jgi:hypothetical protein
MGIISFRSQDVIEFPPEAEPIDHLLKKIDLALYEGKATGRNRIVICLKDGGYDIVPTGPTIQETKP